jgi:hypothetical protein
MIGRSEGGPVTNGTNTPTPGAWSVSTPEVVDFKEKVFRKGQAEDYVSKSTNIPYVPLDLRYGVEFSEKQSFLACMCDIYSYKQSPELNKLPPTVEEMRTLLAVMLLDETEKMFLSFPRGKVIAPFVPQVHGMVGAQGATRRVPATRPARGTPLAG